MQALAWWGLSLWVAASTPERVPLGDATEVSVRMGAGDLQVRARRGSEVELQASKTLGADTCKARTRSQGRIFFIDLSDPNGRLCAIDLVLYVPPKVGMSITQASGKTMVSGTRGPLKLRIGEGNAVIGGTFDKLDGEIGSGSVSLQGLAGDGSLKVGHGNVQIFFASKATSTLALDVGEGNVTLFADRPIASSITTTTPAPASPWPPGSKATINVSGAIGSGRLALRAASR